MRVRIPGMNFLAVPCLALFLAACSGGQQSTEGASPDQEGEPQTMNMVVRATPRGTDEILVTWVDRLADESGYVVERKGPDDEDFQLAVVLGPNRMSWLDSNLVGGASYQYRVSALQSGQTFLSVEEPTATVSSEGASLPASPLLLRARALDTQTIEVAWLDCSDNETGFVVEVGGGPSGVLYNVPANAQSAVVSGLSPGAMYSVSVYAVNADGESISTRLVNPAINFGFSIDSSSVISRNGRYDDAIFVQMTGEPDQIFHVESPTLSTYIFFDGNGKIMRQEVTAIDSHGVSHTRCYRLNYSEDNSSMLIANDYLCDESVEYSLVASFDSDGNLSVWDLTNTNGHLITYTYDDLGRMIAAEETAGGNPYSTLHKTYDDQARNVVETNGFSEKTTYYDSNWFPQKYVDRTLATNASSTEFKNIMGDSIWSGRDNDGDGILDETILMKPLEAYSYEQLVWTSDDDSDGLVDQIDVSEGNQWSSMNFSSWYDGIGQDFVPEFYKYRRLTEYDADHYWLEEGEMHDDNSDGTPEYDYHLSKVVLKSSYSGLNP